MAQIYSGFYIRSHSRSLPKHCVLRHALCGHMIQHPGTKETPPGPRRTPQDQADTPLAGRTPPAGRPPQDQGEPPWDQADPPGPRRTPQDQAPAPGRENPPTREEDCIIRSMSGRYASYWNAFLLEIVA